MVELMQKNPDYVTQEELEGFLNNYENYIDKFQRVNNDPQKFLFFLKKHRVIIEDVIKNIIKIQLNVDSVNSTIDQKFNFHLHQIIPSSTKPSTLRGGVIIETWNTINLLQLKFALYFKINQKESFNYTADLSTLTFGGRWVPGIIFEKFYNYVPNNIQEGDKILFNINIHTPYTSGGGSNYGYTYHRFYDIEMNQSIIESKSNIINSKSRSNLNSLKKILLSSILIFGLYYAMEYFGYGFSYFQNTSHVRKTETSGEKKQSGEDEKIKEKKRNDEEKKDIENFNNGDPIYGKSYFIKVFSGKYPNGSMSRLSKVDISGLSKSELDVMQNEIYARHGLIFKSKNINTYFTKQEWYKPKFHNVNNFLSEVEKENLEYIENIKSKLSN